MKVKRDNRTTLALTLVEVLVVIVVVVILFAVFIPPVSRPARVKRIVCTNNLKQLGIAGQVFAADHHDRLPMEISANEGGTKELGGFGLVVPHFLVLSNELNTPKVLVCPADERMIAPDFSELRGINISYFAGLDARQTNSASPLAGDRNITNGFPGNNRILCLTTNQPVGWTKEIHQHCGNVVLADGSVQQATSSRLGDLLRASGVATNRLAIP